MAERMAENEREAEELRQRVEAQQGILDKTIGDISNEARKYGRRETSSRLANNWVRAGLVLLAVAAPSLVTYQTQVGDRPYLALFTIILTALAGAGASLQSIFRWDERYARALMTSHYLKVLQSIAAARKEDVLSIRSSVERMVKLQQLNTWARESLTNILINDISAEARLVTQAASPQQLQSGSPPQMLTQAEDQQQQDQQQQQPGVNSQTSAQSAVASLPPAQYGGTYPFTNPP